MSLAAITRTFSHIVLTCLQHQSIRTTAHLLASEAEVRREEFLGTRQKNAILRLEKNTACILRGASAFRNATFFYSIAYLFSDVYHLLFELALAGGLAQQQLSPAAAPTKQLRCPAGRMRLLTTRLGWGAWDPAVQRGK